jgi:ankyrin repeat protein
MLAVIKKHFPIAEMLLETGKVNLNYKNKNSETLLMMAERQGL